jgi:hypothetical protein
MNAREELLEMLSGRPADMLAAEVWLGDPEEKGKVVAKLPVDHTTADLRKFLSDLDLEYYESYGSQELFGTVWLMDGTWLEREEYGGSEWWVRKATPVIPAYLAEPSKEAANE